MIICSVCGRKTVRHVKGVCVACWVKAGNADPSISRRFDWQQRRADWILSAHAGGPVYTREEALRLGIIKEEVTQGV